MSIEYEQLKITALEIGEPLKDKNGKIHPDTKKNLKPGTFNFYSKDSSVPKDFFKFSKHNPNSYRDSKSHTDSSPKNNLNISISAVVGKNGSGKSTIVEEMIRLINNLGYMAIDKTLMDLSYELSIAGLYSNNKLYFSIFKKEANREETEEKYCISPEDCIIDDNMQNKNSKKLIFSKYEKETDKYEEYINLESKLKRDDRDNRAGRMSSSFFYTIVVNNSAYAFNTRDFEEEWRPKGDRNLHWINGIFHKNDGYQTPIVLNPMRTEGNIDINTETQLAKDRIISLFLSKDIQDVNSQNVFDSLIIARPFESDTKGKKIKDNEIWKWGKLKCEIYRELKTTIIEAWQKKGYDFKQPHNYDYELATEYLAYKTLSIVWSYGYGVLKNELVTKKYNIYGPFIDDVNNLEFDSNEYYIWNDKKGKNNPVNSPEVEAEKAGNKPKTSREYSEEDAKKYESRRDELVKKLEKDVKSLVNILDKNKSHITLKIRQTLAFLVLRHYDLEKNPLNNDEKFRPYVINHGQVGYGGSPRLNSSTGKDPLSAEKEFRDKFSAWMEAVSNLKNYHLFTPEEVTIPKKRDDPKNKYSEQRKLIKKYDWSSLDLVPAPCFKTEIIIKNKAINKNNKGINDEYKITRLSSGERQQINTISTILYHLRNIDSVKKGKKDRSVIKYKHVNLILDEIELYFHPEMQRTFIYELLTALSKLKIKDIKSINIMLLTHSPFILSDIPKDNVLFLQDGKPREVDTETFGANIHTLYRNSFFMEGAPMGEFAKNKIKSLFERVKEKDMKEDDVLLNEIKLVEEPIIRSQLLKLYKENTSHNFCNKGKRIEELEDKIFKRSEK